MTTTGQEPRRVTRAEWQAELRHQRTRTRDDREAVRRAARYLGGSRGITVIA